MEHIRYWTRSRICLILVVLLPATKIAKLMQPIEFPQWQQSHGESQSGTPLHPSVSNYSWSEEVISNIVESIGKHTRKGKSDCMWEARSGKRTGTVESQQPTRSKVWKRQNRRVKVPQHPQEIMYISRRQRLLQICCRKGWILITELKKKNASQSAKKSL